MSAIEIEARAHAAARPSSVYAVAKDSSGYPRWSRIGSFEHARDGASETCGVGSLRIYRTPPLKLLEEVVELIPERRVGYTLISGLPFRDYRACIDLTPALDGGTDIRWSARFYAAYPGTDWMFRTFMQAVFDEMAPALAREAERVKREGAAGSQTATSA